MGALLPDPQDSAQVFCIWALASVHQGWAPSWSRLEKTHTLGQVVLPQSVWQEHIGKRLQRVERVVWQHVGWCLDTWRYGKHLLAVPSAVILSSEICVWEGWVREFVPALFLQGRHVPAAGTREEAFHSFRVRVQNMFFYSFFSLIVMFGFLYWLFWQARYSYSFCHLSWVPHSC